MADGDLFGWSGDEGLELGCAYFFALRPSAAVTDEIGQQRELAIRALRVQRPSRVEDERLHLSLCAPKRLKRLRAPFEESLKLAGDEVTARAFELRLQGLDLFQCGFGSPCVVLRSDGATSASVQSLKDTITSALFRRGFGWDASTLAPHVTLFYASDVAVPADAAGPAIDWRVHEFAFMKSWVGRHEHTTLKTWPLS
jgi:RNA 2',3'-cyclic 3'-phosphodiesterase